ncbi:hypothetical protein D3C85_1857700 [compost metagenome]
MQVLGIGVHAGLAPCGKKGLGGVFSSRYRANFICLNAAVVMDRDSYIALGTKHLRDRALLDPESLGEIILGSVPG